MTSWSGSLKRLSRASARRWSTRKNTSIYSRPALKPTPLWLFRLFYLEYPKLTPAQILYAPRKESGEPTIQHAGSDESAEISAAVRAKPAIAHGHHASENVSNN